MSNAFDYNIVSTHDLLVRLFATEVGLSSPVSPHAQYEALLSNYPHLKQSALANLAREVPLPRLCTLGTEHAAPARGIPGKDDALAFAELYRGIELFIGPDTQVDDYAVTSVLNQWVLPMAARKIEAQPALKAGAIGLLNAHHRAHHPKVGERNRHALKEIFRFSEGFLAQIR